MICPYASQNIPWNRWPTALTAVTAISMRAMMTMATCCSLSCFSTATASMLISKCTSLLHCQRCNLCSVHRAPRIAHWTLIDMPLKDKEGRGNCSMTLKSEAAKATFIDELNEMTQHADDLHKWTSMFVSPYEGEKPRSGIPSQTHGESLATTSTRIVQFLTLVTF